MEVKTISVGDTQLAYVEQGAGIPVLFVHGAGGDWRTFDPLRELIAAKYRYIAYSRRYHYPNPWADHGQKYTIQQHAQDLADFIRALGLPRVHLVGGSYGGRIAAWFALQYPDLLRSLAISEPGLVDGDTLAAGAAVASWNADMAAMVSSLRAGDLKRTTSRFFDAILDDKGAFERFSAERQQRGYDNAQTFGPMLASPKVPPGPPQ
ncbi:alpha/beta hydrolase [Undibacterium sp.]|jgi:pimeloyl-ACP methyl ester carboxylesterase|uniref:alpha/beta fold hydrolase n=1 Tax=Undibacterium sp. TaxID=1914977 RepID=UPI002D150EED|nr:alpha/beta hydrolase [Undibacterium sp.]HTD05546.1 alpha/beta hydrolase [Undibacterium sp.]